VLIRLVLPVRVRSFELPYRDKVNTDANAKPVPGIRAQALVRHLSEALDRLANALRARFKHPNVKFYSLPLAIASLRSARTCKSQRQSAAPTEQAGTAAIVRQRPRCPLHQQRREKAAAAGSSLMPQSRSRVQPDWRPRCSSTRIYLSLGFLPFETCLVPLEPFIRSSFVSSGQQS